ncbi:MAG: ABC transporter ATP-binding protein [Armatimonadota bacterium]|nr:ABC transporter ATP-binding protein [Armatimonadota bacterium]MDR7486415.1 ABC transporter ATP-binding protein [Armatimonadota bacterium]MDR7532548.1 ABC transporter ATP-binding protein [Armatimonadota bacterium]MDR7535563.1 ABC transporter ATP-binding protein [Armatimonadota bacterium]
MRDLLVAERLSKAFGGVRAVRDLSFSVGDGEILGLIGPNGSGKTTAFNLITGFLVPDAGRVWLDGAEITGLPPHAICARGVARTFQLVRPFPHLTALQNVLVGRIYGRAPQRRLRAAAAEAAELLTFVGLAGKAHVLARHLTLVDRKRLELARALATRPRLLLLDEFMAGLTPQEVQVAIAMIRRVRDGGVAVIMIEHLVHAVLGTSDRVVVLNAGQPIAEGPPEAVARDPRVLEAYLGDAGA